MTGFKYFSRSRIYSIMNMNKKYFKGDVLTGLETDTTKAGLHGSSSTLRKS